MENLTGGTPPVRPLPCVVPCKLYFTEHETTQHSGIYSNSRMTVVDLRRALPSVFLRPGAQHGWTVKMNSNKKNMSRGDYSFAKDVVAILRIPLSLADELIGGALLSQENLFPPADYDQ